MAALILRTTYVLFFIFYFFLSISIILSHFSQPEYVQRVDRRVREFRIFFPNARTPQKP